MLSSPRPHPSLKHTRKAKDNWNLFIFLLYFIDSLFIYFYKREDVQKESQKIFQDMIVELETWNELSLWNYLFQNKKKGGQGDNRYIFVIR